MTPEKFASKLRLIANGCLEWTGKRHSWGYGTFRKPGTKKYCYAHRFALELKLGRILKPGEQANHHCDNPPCCNPDHLFLGNNQLNIKDMLNKGRNNPMDHSCPGEKNGRAILTDAKVREIWRLRKTGLSYSRIAKEMGCKKHHVAFIIQGKTWRHITQ
jgi:hypothetical protein